MTYKDLDVFFICHHYLMYGPRGGGPQEKLDEVINDSNIFLAIIGATLGGGGVVDEVHLAENKPNDCRGLVFLESEKVEEDVIIYKKKIRDEGKWTTVTYNESELADKIHLFLADVAINVLVNKKDDLPRVEEKSLTVVSKQSLQLSPPKKEGDEKGKEVIAISEHDEVRNYLRAAAMLYDERIPDGLLGLHEINILYNYRKETKPESFEINLLFRSLIADLDGYRAGWYWFGFISKDEKLMPSFLFQIVRNDSNHEVQKGAMQLLLVYWKNSFIDQLLEESDQLSDYVLLNMLPVLKAFPTVKSLEFVNKILIQKTTKKVLEEFSEVKLYLLSMLQPNNAASVIIEEKIKKYTGLSVGFYKKLTTENLIKLLGEPIYETFRGEALKELICRNSVSVEELNSLSRSKSFELRMIALSALINKKKIVDYDDIRSRIDLSKDDTLFNRASYKRDDILKQFLLENDEDFLVNLLSWGKRDADLVYEVLGKKYFSLFKGKIRKEIKSRFVDLKKDYYDGLKLLEKKLSLLESPSAKEYLKTIEQVRNEKYDALIEGEFITAGLKVLIECGNVRDISIAKSLLYHPEASVRRESFNLICKYGGKTHINLLFEFLQNAINEYVISQEDYSKVFALDFSVLEKGIKTNQKEFICAAMGFAYSNELSLGDGLVETCLYSEEKRVRDTAVSFLILTKKKKYLLSLLDKYIKKGTYYYDVYSSLDKALYAPSKIKKLFKKNIDKDLQRIIG